MNEMRSWNKLVRYYLKGKNRPLRELWDWCWLKDRRGCCEWSSRFYSSGSEIIQIDEDKKEFGLERLAELVAQYKVDRLLWAAEKHEQQ